MSFFAIALLIGALLSGGRRMIGNRWFVAGALIAVAFEVPDLWWQAQHGWATIAMTQALHRENGGLANIGTSVAGQLAVVTLALARVWVAGLRFLWRSGRPLWRAMAWAYGLLFVVFAVTTGAQTYYLAAAYVYLLAAGAVAIDRWLRAGPADCAISCWPARSPPRSPSRSSCLCSRWLIAAGPLRSTKTWPRPSAGPGSCKPLTACGNRCRRASAPAPGDLATADYGEAGAINELGRGIRAADRRERAEQRVVVGAREQPRDHRGGRHARTRRYHHSAATAYLRQLFAHRASGGHAVESVRNPQPGVGWPRLRLHRPPPPVGPAMATVAPLRVTRCQSQARGGKRAGQSAQPAQLRCRRFA